MADNQEKENARKPQPLLPISWPRSTEDENTKKTWKDLSCWKKVLILASSVALLLFASILTRFAIFSHGRFHPPAFKVDSLSVTPFDISSFPVRANWDITFSITNPNYRPLKLYYRDVKVSVFYREKSISSAAIEPFFLNLNGKPIAGYSKNIINGSMAQDLVADWSSDSLFQQDIETDSSSGSMKLTLTVDATVFANPETPKKLEIIPVTVSCEDVEVEFSSHTKSSTWTMLEPSSKCKSKWVPDRILY